MLARRLTAIALILIIGAAILISLRRASRPHVSPRVVVNTGYRFGQVEVDTLQRRIRFPARVARDSGHVLTLVHLAGYPWLKDSAAVTSDARLLDLQQAIAALSWALWDSLWTGRHPAYTFRLTIGDSGFYSILQPGQEELTTTTDSTGLTIGVFHPFELPDLIFLGSPEFDPAALYSREAADCPACPAFGREQAIVLSALRRRSLELRPGALPPPGSEVEVRLQLLRGPAR